jgi:hypothetical protein
MPQAGCNHHKQPVALSEHRHHHPHLGKWRAGASATCHRPDRGCRQHQGWRGLHAIDVYKWSSRTGHRAALTATAATRPRDPGPVGHCPNDHLCQDPEAAAPATFSSNHGLEGHCATLFRSSHRTRRGGRRRHPSHNGMRSHCRHQPHSLCRWRRPTAVGGWAKVDGEVAAARVYPEMLPWERRGALRYYKSRIPLREENPINLPATLLYLSWKFFFKIDMRILNALKVQK